MIIHNREKLTEEHNLEKPPKNNTHQRETSVEYNLEKLTVDNNVNKLLINNTHCLYIKYNNKEKCSLKNDF